MEKFSIFSVLFTLRTSMVYLSYAVNKLVIVVVAWTQMFKNELNLKIENRLFEMNKSSFAKINSPPQYKPALLESNWRGVFWFLLIYFGDKAKK